jgi:hypothetical protein
MAMNELAEISDDPLALRDSQAGRRVTEVQSGPLPQVCALYSRLMNRDYADSVEIKVSLLSQMMFLIYKDLKENIQQ